MRVARSLSLNRTAAISEQVGVYGIDTPIHLVVGIRRSYGQENCRSIGSGGSSRNDEWRPSRPNTAAAADFGRKLQGSSGTHSERGCAVEGGRRRTRRALNARRRQTCVPPPSSPSSRLSAAGSALLRAAPPSPPSSPPLQWRPGHLCPHSLIFPHRTRELVRRRGRRLTPLGLSPWRPEAGTGTCRQRRCSCSTSRSNPLRVFRGWNGFAVRAFRVLLLSPHPFLQD
jgi:hypothetical protein